jgi:hypothetical protein
MAMPMLTVDPFQGAMLDDFGYPVILETGGIRCGQCKRRHVNVDTVRECYYIAAEEIAEMNAEIEAEKRATRFWEEGF